MTATSTSPATRLSVSGNYMVGGIINTEVTWNGIVPDSGDDSTTYTDMVGVNGITYWYQVGAIGPGGIGDPSSIAQATTNDTPASPSRMSLMLLTASRR